MSYHYSFQLGNGVSTSVQLLWMGIVAILVAGLSEFVDDNDRFFTPNIGEITAFEWGICIGIAFIGKSRWLYMFRVLLVYNLCMFLLSY